jgi:hypothetical protein
LARRFSGNSSVTGSTYDRRRRRGRATFVLNPVGDEQEYPQRPLRARHLTGWPACPRHPLQQARRACTAPATRRRRRRGSSRYRPRESPLRRRALRRDAGCLVSEHHEVRRLSTWPRCVGGVGLFSR